MQWLDVPSQGVQLTNLCERVPHNSISQYEEWHLEEKDAKHVSECSLPWLHSLPS